MIPHDKDEAWREAMDLWREDAARGAAGFDPRVMADRVLRGGPDAVATLEVRTARTARRYAAAAVILLGIGVGGATWLGPVPARATPGVKAAIHGLEQERIDVAAYREWELFRPTWQRPAEKGR